jgi:hypothetical protein
MMEYMTWLNQVAAIDANNDGVIMVAQPTFGANGLSSSVETSNNSGTLKYAIRDTDADGIKNYIEIDSDNDLCNDVIEAGFLIQIMMAY